MVDHSCDEETTRTVRPYSSCSVLNRGCMPLDFGRIYGREISVDDMLHNESHHRRNYPRAIGELPSGKTLHGACESFGESDHAVQLNYRKNYSLKNNSLSGVFVIWKVLGLQ